MTLSTKILTSVTAAVLLGVVAPVVLLRAPAPSPSAAATQRARFDVQGMTSARCPAVAERILAAVDGVSTVDATYDDHSVTIIFDPTRTDPAELAARLAADSSLRMTLIELTTAA